MNRTNPVLAAVTVARLAAWAVPATLRAQQRKSTDFCRYNTRNLSEALFMYAADSDDRLPRHERWFDEALLYDYRDLTCTEVEGEVPGYALNVRFTRLDTIACESKSPLLFETVKIDRSPHDKGASLADPPRHGEAGWAAFPDGSVRPLTPADARKRLQE